MFRVVWNAKKRQNRESSKVTFGRFGKEIFTFFKRKNLKNLQKEFSLKKK